VAASSIEERDEWIAQISYWVNSLKPVECNDKSTSQAMLSPKSPEKLQENMFAHSSASAQAAKAAIKGLNCLGVTIVKENKLNRLQAHQPCLLSPSGSSNSDSDSLLNAIATASDNKHAPPRNLIENTFPEEFISKYYQSLKKLKSKSHDDESIQSNLHLFRVLAAFNDTVLKYVRIIIDEYHRKVPVSPTALYEFGPVKISLLPGYNQNDETIIQYTNAINRQELHAIRWINDTADISANTMLVSCVEYKGFRFSVYLDVPLGANTCLLDLCPQESGHPIVIKEEYLEELNQIGQSLHLAINPHLRLQDQRVIASALHPSVELHSLPRAITGYPKGLYLLNLSQLPPSWPANPDSPLLSGVHRFRPEFLTRFPVGRLMAADYSPEKNLAAFRFLLDEHVPSVVEKLENLDEVLIDSLEWTEYLHREGINCALLGRLAQHSRLPHVKEHLLIEMIARTAKRAIQAQLRGSILHFKEVQAMRVDEELRAIILHTLATILGNTPGNMLNYVLELLEATCYKFDYYHLDLDVFRRLPRQALFLAIQHHCGLQFVDRIYDFSSETPFAKEDFLMFIPTLDQGPISARPFITAYSHTFKCQTPKEIGITSALYQLGAEVLPLGEASWQYATKRAAIAKQFVLASRAHANSGATNEAIRFIDLARATAPAVHAIRAFIELEAFEQTIHGLSNAAPHLVNRELSNLKALHTRISSEIDAHLGPHHPVIVEMHQKVAKVWASLASSQLPRPLIDSLDAHQLALAVSTKALGRVHRLTRNQVLRIAEINHQLERYDEALSFFNDALKSAQQCGANALTLGDIILSIASCHHDKGNLDDALEQARRAQAVLEASEGNQSHSTNVQLKQELLDRAYTQVATLAQKIFEDVHEDTTTILSGDIQAHLNLAIECYERIFDTIRQKPDMDGNKLLNVLKKLIGLKLRLARPSQKILIGAIRNRKAIAASQSAVSDLIMRVVAAASASSYMDRVLERLDKPTIISAIGNSGLSNTSHPSPPNSSEVKEVLEEFSCLLQIIDS